MSITSTSSDFQELSDLLTRLNQEGGFALSLLTDIQGLLIASSDVEGHNPEQHSAAVALIQKTIGQTVKMLGFTQTEEFTLHNTDGQRLVCRPFQVDNHELILVVTTMDKKHSYRRLTSQAITEIYDIVKKSRG